MLVPKSQSGGEGLCPCKAGPSATQVTAYRTGFGGCWPKWASEGVTLKELRGQY